MKGFIVATLLALTVGAFTIYKYQTSGTPTYADRLQEIADQVNSMNTTWKAGRNLKWENQTKESMISFMMPSELHKSRPTRPGMKVTHPLSMVNSAPASFDSRTAWPDCESLREVRDQSACGSCWAFGAAETMSDRICIHSGQKDQTRVSAEDLVECCSDCGYGCQGGFPGAAFDFWKETGVVTGGLYADTKYCLNYPFAPCAHHVPAGKYQACPTTDFETPSCSRKCTNGSDYASSKTFAKSVSSHSGEAQLKTEISTNGPVEVAFTVYEDFPTYKTGVYQHVHGGQLGGHAVKMVGYGTEDGTPYWIVANSWNETWGDNGFFKILRGNNECGIEDEGYAGVPAA